MNITTKRSYVSVCTAVLVIALAQPASASESDTVTYSKDIAPILRQNCVICHHPGDVAPFSLLTFADAKKHRHEIALVTEDRQMPPWKAVRGFGQFKNSKQLTQAEIDLIQKWVKNDAPEGDAPLGPPPTFNDGWRLGPPDLTVTMPEPYVVRADGDDVYQCFVVPLNLPEDKYIIAVDYRPGNRQVVHHAVFSQDDTGEALDRDRRDPDVGYRTPDRGTGLTADCHAVIGIWAPGQEPEYLPPGVAVKLRRNSAIVIQNHYHPRGKTEADQSSLGLYFAKSPPKSLARYTGIQIQDFEIPAGAKHHLLESFTPHNIGFSIIAVAPHMHLLGEELKASVKTRDSEIPLIWIKDWDLSWQSQYVLSSPLHVPRGAEMRLQAWYNNSAENTRNPNNPPKKVHEGPASTDEMARVVMLIVDDERSYWHYAAIAAVAVFAGKLGWRFCKTRQQT